MRSAASARALRSSDPERWQALAWAAPFLLLVLPFFALPIVAVLWVSFVRGPIGASSRDGLGTYLAMVLDPYYIGIYANTLAIGVLVTAVTLVIGLPFAYQLVRWAGRWRPVLIWLLYLPLIVSVIVRVFGWIVITADRGVLNALLLGAGVVDRPLRLLYEVEAMVIAMTHRYLPLMVLPLANAIAKIDPAMERAATDLGASRLQTMRTILFPLALPGMFAGCQLVFASVLSDFVMPSLVGTTRFPMMAPAIYEQAVMVIDWPRAATMSVVLLVFVAIYLLAAAALYRRLAAWERLG